MQPHCLLGYQSFACARMWAGHVLLTESGVDEINVLT
jgi:hypothetical protein